MLLTKKQEEGLKIILERHKNNEKYTVISGYAGTGKSTLVKFAIDALNVEKSKVAYATFTGKAAEVLRKKGNDGAMTLHRLLYDHVPKPGGGFFRKPKAMLDYSIVVVDEVSMVPRSMIDLLLRHKVYVIFLGDPFQLPQIDKNEAHDLLDHPHVFLDEVMRQAAESEIIQLTMKIRNQEPIQHMKGNEVIVMPYKEFVDGCYLWADQIIVATNAKRKQVNEYVRKMLGYEGLPQQGERMICLRNYWEDISDSGEALVNGTTGIIKSVPIESFRAIPRYIQAPSYRLDTLVCDFATDEGSEFHGVEMDKHMILTGEKCVDWRLSYQLGKLKNRIGDIVPREFDYGYAITGHKSQGSQWEKVLVLEESFPFDKVEHARWLYTVCTRPEEKLVLVRD